MEDLKWIFDSVGTEILSSLASFLFGGIWGYKIGVKNKVKQRQKAGNNSRQTQIGSITTINHDKENER